MWNLIKKRSWRGGEGRLCRTAPRVNQGKKKKRWWRQEAGTSDNLHDPKLCTGHKDLKRLKQEVTPGYGSKKTQQILTLLTTQGLLKPHYQGVTSDNPWVEPRSVLAGGAEHEMSFAPRRVRLGLWWEGWGESPSSMSSVVCESTAWEKPEDVCVCVGEALYVDKKRRTTVRVEQCERLLFNGDKGDKFWVR